MAPASPSYVWRTPWLTTDAQPRPLRVGPYNPISVGRLCIGMGTDQGTGPTRTTSGSNGIKPMMTTAVAYRVEMKDRSVQVMETR